MQTKRPARPSLASRFLVHSPSFSNASFYTIGVKQELCRRRWRLHARTASRYPLFLPTPQKRNYANLELGSLPSQKIFILSKLSLSNFEYHQRELSVSLNCACEHMAGRNTVMTYTHVLGSRTTTCSSPSGEHAYCTVDLRATLLPGLSGAAPSSLTPSQYAPPVYDSGKYRARLVSPASQGHDALAVNFIRFIRLS